MLERDMEDLIAAYPDEFFPRYELKLIGRQQTFQGVGRFDLLFSDRHGMNILMELKAVPAGYETIDQVSRYRDELERLGHTNHIMWIVAPVIPPGLRTFLVHLGIEFTEIQESEFRRIATLKNIQLRSDVRTQSSTPSINDGITPARVLHVSGERIGTDEWGFGIGTQPSFLLKALEAHSQTKQEIRSAFMNHFYPALSYAEAKSKSGFGVFFSDSKRPICTYHASRALLIKEDPEGILSLNAERASRVKKAIKEGILDQLRGVHFQRNKSQFDEIQRKFGLPTED